MFAPRSSCNNPYTNFFSWNQDGQWRVWDGVIYVFKTSTKLCKSLPYTKVLYEENFGKASFFVRIFTFVKRQGYFFTFSASDSSWLESGGFLNSFWLTLFSELILISILLKLSFKEYSSTYIFRERLQNDEISIKQR